MTAAWDPEAVRAALDSALPPGLDVVDAVEAHTSDFAQRLEASRWRIELVDVELPVAQAARDAFWAADHIEVQRMAKSGLRTFDAREPVAHLQVEVDSSAPCVILNVVVRHVTVTVRPDDVLAALRRVADLEPPVPPRVTRLAQGPLDEATCTVGDPFAPDRRG